MASRQARLAKTREGLVPEERGWFVVSAAEARWKESAPFGIYCNFEGKRSFLQLGINISVLQPGQSLGRYHLESGVPRRRVPGLRGRAAPRVSVETNDPAEAYVDVARSRSLPYGGWLD
jgi:hypothetical protein